MPSNNPIAPRNSKRGGLRLRRPGVGSLGPNGLKSPCRISTKFWSHFSWMSNSRYMNRNSEIILRKDFAKSEMSSCNDFVEASTQNCSKKLTQEIKTCGHPNYHFNKQIESSTLRGRIGSLLRRSRKRRAFQRLRSSRWCGNPSSPPLSDFGENVFLEEQPNIKSWIGRDESTVPQETENESMKPVLC